MRDLPLPVRAVVAPTCARSIARTNARRGRTAIERRECVGRIGSTSAFSTASSPSPALPQLPRYLGSPSSTAPRAAAPPEQRWCGRGVIRCAPDIVDPAWTRGGGRQACAPWRGPPALRHPVAQLVARSGPAPARLLRRRSLTRPPVSAFVNKKKSLPPIISSGALPRPGPIGLHVELLRLHHGLARFRGTSSLSASAVRPCVVAISSWRAPACGLPLRLPTRRSCCRPHLLFDLVSARSSPVVSLDAAVPSEGCAARARGSRHVLRVLARRVGVGS